MDNFNESGKTDSGLYNQEENSQSCNTFQPTQIKQNIIFDIQKMKLFKALINNNIDIEEFIDENNKL